MYRKGEKPHDSLVPKSTTASLQREKKKKKKKKKKSPHPNSFVEKKYVICKKKKTTPSYLSFNVQSINRINFSLLLNSPSIL
jgi:hypothetical protein